MIGQFADLSSSEPRVSENAIERALSGSFTPTVCSFRSPLFLVPMANSHLGRSVKGNARTPRKHWSTGTAPGCRVWYSNERAVRPQCKLFNCKPRSGRARISRSPPLRWAAAETRSDQLARQSRARRAQSRRAYHHSGRRRQRNAHAGDAPESVELATRVLVTIAPNVSHEIKAHPSVSILLTHFASML